MNFLILCTLVVFAIAVFFLYITFRTVVQKKTAIINSAILIGFVGLCFAPVILQNLTKTAADQNNPLLPIATVGFFVLITLLYAFFTRGYSLYGIDEDEFKKAVFSALNVNHIKYEESFNKILLVEINNELTISCQPKLGTGMIKLKNRKDGELFNSLMQEIRRHYSATETKPKIVSSIAYSLISLLLICFLTFLISLMLQSV